MAGLGGVPIWDYRTQKRRVLTFALDGRAKLPLVEPLTAEGRKGVLDYPIDKTAAAKGAALYGANCSLCHGPGARAGGAAPDLRQSGVVADEGTFAEVVRSGLLETSGMPQFDLTDQQLNSLRQYIGSEAQ